MKCLTVSQVAALGGISPAAVESAFAWCIRRTADGAFIPLAAVADVTRRTEEHLAATCTTVEVQ